MPLHTRRMLLDEDAYQLALARVRRVERQLIGEYEALVATALAGLEPASHSAAVELCELPDMVRGYEDIKLRTVERFRERASELSAELA